MPSQSWKLAKWAAVIPLAMVFQLTGAPESAWSQEVVTGPAAQKSLARELRAVRSRLSPAERALRVAVTRLRRGLSDQQLAKRNRRVLLATLRYLRPKLKDVRRVRRLMRVAAARTLATTPESPRSDFVNAERPTKRALPVARRLARRNGRLHAALARARGVRRQRGRSGKPTAQAAIHREIGGVPGAIIDKLARYGFLGKKARGNPDYREKGPWRWFCTRHA